MKWGAEFWMRVAIAVGFVLLVILAPSVLFPFIVSLVIATLLNPVAHRIYALAEKWKIPHFPYDFAIIISFAIFIAVIYFIAVHIFVPFKIGRASCRERV